MSEIIVAFVCVENAGRSQMAAAFAERIVEERMLDVRVVSGGTAPAEAVHPIVAEAMVERGIDLSGREPRAVSREGLFEADVVVTMGCTDGVCPAGFVGEYRDWDLEDPGGKTLEEVRRIRDEVERRVAALMEELDTKSPGA